jgi:hypothetical protein
MHMYEQLETRLRSEEQAILWAACDTAGPDHSERTQVRVETDIGAG